MTTLEGGKKEGRRGRQAQTSSPPQIYRWGPINLIYGGGIKQKLSKIGKRQLEVGKGAAM